MSISDELRAAGNRLFLRESDGYGTIMSLADRIDDEMVELPRGKDGKPLHLGDTVYDPVGLEHEIAEISFTENYSHTIMEPKIVVRNGCNFIYPKSFTHSKPEPEDSWESIADELEEWSEDNRVNGDANIFSRAAYFADRIRKLAKESGHVS